MAAIHLIVGPQGAGKSTYARELAASVAGVRFSIDEWMQHLYGADLPTPMDMGWIVERVGRCEAQMWRLAHEIGRCGGNAVLDLGFMKAATRARFRALAADAGLDCRLHYLTAPPDVRRARVMARNVEQGETFAFVVSPGMFDAMEMQFEVPSATELDGAVVRDTYAV